MIGQNDIYLCSMWRITPLNLRMSCDQRTRFHEYDVHEFSIGRHENILRKADSTRNFARAPLRNLLHEY